MHRRLSLASRADARSTTRFPSISSFELWERGFDKGCRPRLGQEFSYLYGLPNVSIDDGKDIRHITILFPPETNGGSHYRRQHTQAGKPQPSTIQRTSTRQDLMKMGQWSGR